MKLRLFFAIGSLLALLVGGLTLLKLAPDALWFSSFGFYPVWRLMLEVKALGFIIGFLLSFAVLATNFSIANKLASKLNFSSQTSIQYPPIIQMLRRIFVQQGGEPQTILNAQPHFFGPLSWLVAGLFSIGFGLAAKSQWLTALTYFNQKTFGIKDPIFENDMGFYVFSLPFLDALQNWFSSLFLLTIIGVVVLYATRNLLPLLFSQDSNRNGVKRHVFILAAIWFLSLAYGMGLNIYLMLFSDKGAVFGAGYTDVNVVKFAHTFVVALFAGLSVLTLITAFTRRVMLPFYGLGVIIAAQIILLNIYPNLIQNYVVNPNQFEKEKPFITHNITYTRLGYGLTNISEYAFPATTTLQASDLDTYTNTIHNIRLWNPGPLKSTFRQLQEIRLYYEFMNVDVDRYMIDGNLTQVMLSARELDIAQLTGKAQTWINRHLVFTHGYGAVMSPVSEITPEGLPHFYLRDVPPTGLSDVTITRPEIYFGENTQHYILANSKQAEFDYPKGNENVYTHYQGKGGIELNSLFKRALFAWHLSDIKLLISPQITNQTRLIYDRTVAEIVRKLAPFVTFDRDPYLVVHDGQLVWMIDGYSLSNRFAYSEPTGRFNYVRNSVKAVVSAYDGATTFYIADPTDPIIQTHAAIFKNVFKSLDEMSASLKAHIRYPKALFEIQAQKFLTYHMTDPQVFYNREDLWALANESYEPNFAGSAPISKGASRQVLRPYYTVMRSPGHDEDTFVLMQPFTPTNKNNLIAWLGVESGGDRYGQMTIYKLPKKKVVFGPMQIESRIDQDPEISQKLTLWGQAGSEVIRGNLMVVPIRDSLLYVEPIYLKATQSELPELKRVIVAYDNQILMAPTLTDAIGTMFDTSLQIDSPTQTADDAPVASSKQPDNKAIQTAIKAVKDALQKLESLIQKDTN